MDKEAAISLVDTGASISPAKKSFKSYDSPDFQMIGEPEIINNLKNHQQSQQHQEASSSERTSSVNDTLKKFSQRLFSSDGNENLTSGNNQSER